MPQSRANPVAEEFSWRFTSAADAPPSIIELDKSTFQTDKSGSRLRYNVRTIKVAAK